MAEGVGTAFLLAAIVGSGIMGERLAGGNGAVALLANTLATGGPWLRLFLRSARYRAFQPGRHVSGCFAGGLSCGDVPGYVSAQAVGAFTGVAAAHAMFSEPLFQVSRHAPVGAAQVFSEFVATSAYIVGHTALLLPPRSRNPW